MMAQYENVNHLLGPTSDWTHPGTLCEELLKDFLRRTLVAGVSADKGYIYGRAVVGGKTIHSPEIDILIHNTNLFRPIYRMGDLVIVQPEAVLGIIQVKRTLSLSQVRRGIQNVVKAKHLLNETLVAKQGHNISPFIFSAVVGFEDKISDSIEARDFYDKEVNQVYSGLVKNYGLDELLAILLLPNFIGSIRQQHTISPIPEKWRNEYYTHRSVVNGKNVVPQTLCGLLNNMIGQKLGMNLEELPPIAFPLEPRNPLQWRIRPVT